MIERVIAASIRRPGIVLGLGLAAVLAGVAALVTSPIDAIPDLADGQVLVATAVPGRGAEEVETRVTRPLAVALRGIPGVRAVRGSSEAGMSMIDLVLDDTRDDGEERSAARAAVAERLAAVAATLPPDVTPQLGPDADATGHVFWYTVEGDGRSLAELRELQDMVVAPAFLAVPGVAEVASAGGMLREWRVETTPERLRGAGVTLDDVYAAVSRAVAASGAEGAAGLLAHAGGEFVVTRGTAAEDPLAVRTSIEEAVILVREGVAIRVRDAALVSLAPAARRGILEKDGREVTGGVVVMRRGENPLAVTLALKARLGEIAPHLPDGVQIVPFYDRSRLVHDAVGTVSRTLLLELLAASLAIVLVMRHLGAAFVVCLTLPLAILLAFLGMRALGTTSNVMSLAGIAITAGVLVDQAIVLADNGVHHLRARFGDEPVRGDTREALVAPCQEVGRPVFFGVAIMVVSFLPVFALGGIEGRMFHPLAWTKTFALVAAGVLTVTVLPAMLPLVLRGRMRSEEDSAIVRSVAAVYRPVLSWAMGRHRFVVIAFAAVLSAAWVVSGHVGREFMPPLDEGSILDMPVTTPRVSLAQAGDDLRARNAVIRSLPEVESVVGKAGRAETATDPSPIEMVETVVTLRPRDTWPRRHLDEEERTAAVARACRAVAATGPSGAAAGDPDLAAITEEATRLYDEAMRARCSVSLAREDAVGLTIELEALAPETFAAAAVRAVVERAGSWPEGAVPGTLRDAVREVAAGWTPTLRAKTKGELVAELDLALRVPGWANIWTQPIINRIDMLSTGIRTEVGVRVLGTRLDQIERACQDVAAALRAVPGASDVVVEQAAGKASLVIEARPLAAAQLGLSAADIERAASAAVAGRIAGDLRTGGVDLPVRVGYARAARDGADAVRRVLVAGTDGTGGAASAAAGGAGTAGGGASGGSSGSSRSAGAMAGMSHGAPRRAARGASAATAEMAPSTSESSWEPPIQRELGEVADVRVRMDPAMIRSENGTLRGLVQCGVRDRDVISFVEEAQERIAAEVTLPDGVRIEWGGQYEHHTRARRTLLVVVPLVLLSILGVLWFAYRDLSHAGLVMLAVPGALAGGVFFQAIFGFRFSVAVWVGYIACFGMATQTGIVMLVYLRQAITNAGGVAAIRSEEALRAIVLDGAVRRLRPKLLTEATTILGLAPMLFAEGAGSEVLRPMAAPLLGGILMADEVIDVFLPVLFYRVERARWRRAHGAT